MQISKGDRVGVGMIDVSSKGGFTVLSKQKKSSKWNYTLYVQKIGWRDRLYGLQIIDARNMTEVWAYARDQELVSHSEQGIMNEMENYAKSIEPGFFKSSTGSGRTPRNIHVRFDCRVCGTEFTRSLSYIKNVKKKGNQVSCCSGKCSVIHMGRIRMLQRHNKLVKELHENKDKHND